MRIRRLSILVVLFVIVQLAGSLALNHLFVRHARESIEVTRQNMIEDGVPVNQRSSVVSALGDMRSQVSSYVMFSSQFQFMLSVFMLIGIFGLWLKESAQSNDDA